MKVKICGITTVETAKAVEQAGADFIGFVFARSKRQIAPADAANITKCLSPNIKKVGVFVNESPGKINEIANLVGLDFIQLHGDETADLAREITYPIIKAFSIDQAEPTTITAFPCDYILIDSPGEAYRGGSGKPFSWELLDELKIARDKLILAGGLSAKNIKQAIQLVQPTGVDISSGVETNGLKDIEKINTFVNNPKQTERLS